jgi:hypothetical protein
MLNWLALLILIAFPADAQSAWTWRNPLPNSFFWRGLSTTDEEILLAGGRAIALSTNGVDWRFREWRFPADVLSVVQAENRLVALATVPETPTRPIHSAVYVSTDGSEFSFLTELPGLFTKVVHGNGRFVACYQGVISSSDAREWKTVRNSERYGPPWDDDVLFAGGKFFYTSGSGICYSTDGVNWEASEPVPA